MPHFEKSSFRVKGRIFTTLDEKNNRIVLKLSSINQSVFCSIDSSILYPVNGAWGKIGWTTVELKKVNKGVLADALEIAYTEVLNRKPFIK